MASGSIIRNLALKRVISEYTSSSADVTYNETLDDGGYLIFVYGLNATSSTLSGIYMASIHSRNSNVRTVIESSVATLSASGSTLTIHITRAWTYVKIFRIP